MGHSRTGPLPQTRKWNDIIDLMAAGAGVSQLASATLDAAEEGLNKARNDIGVIETVWLLVRLPLAARQPDLVLALSHCDVTVSEKPGLLDIVAAVSDAVDAKMPNNRGRTDLGEMAQTSAAETLVHVVGGRVRNLFDTTPDDVRSALAGLVPPKQFGILARDFFSRFVRKCLTYFLSKALPTQTGEGKRFGTVAEQSKFTDALGTHCREASEIVEAYAGDWMSKHKFETAGAIGRKETAGFVAHALTKLVAELKLRAGSRGN